MKESLYGSAGSELVFRETFNSLSDLSSNTNEYTDISISDGSGVFNGSSSYIDALPCSFSNGMTVRAIVTFDAQSYQTIFSHGFGGDTIVLGTGVESGIGTENDINLGMFYGSWKVASSGVTPVIGQKYEIVGTMDNSYLRIYIDGIEEGNMSGVGMDQKVLGTYIGRRHFASHINWFDGNIDLVEVYNRALSAAEIKNLYTGSAHRPLSSRRESTIGQTIELNGTDQYLYNNNPNNLDLNGTERISPENNRTFETANDWQGLGNHSISISDEESNSGTYSGKIVLATTGEYTDDYVNLSSLKYTPLVDGEKYTLELNAKDVGVLSSELLSGDESDFTSSTGGWNGVRTTLSQSGGELIAEVTATGSPVGISKLSTMTIGKYYSLSFEAKSPTITSTMGYFGNLAQVAGDVNPNLSTTFQTYSHIFKATGTSIYIGATSTGISIGDTVYYDNISIKEVTPAQLTATIGSQSETWTTDPTAFDKHVWNFQASSSEVGEDLKLYLNQADTVYVDDVSLTQAYDMVVQLWLNTPSDLTTYSGIIGTADWSNVNTGFRLYTFSGGNTLGMKVSNIAQSVSDAYTQTGWYLLTFTIDRVGNMSLYRDGSLKGVSDISGAEKPTDDGDFNVGQVDGLSSLFKGEMGQTQIYRLTDVASATYSTTQLGTISGGGAERVAYYDWKGNVDTFLDDKSGTRNDLNSNNVALDNITQGTGYKEILRIDARNGSLDNKYAGETINGNVVPSVTSTDTTVKRNGDIWTADFNGTTSKLDCGDYDDLTGDKSFIAWIKPRSLGETNLGRIISNGGGAIGSTSRFILYVYSSPGKIYMRSRFDTYVESANVYSLNRWALVVATRTSNGTSNIYINGVLSGTANQAGGEPQAGTTNITIGNDNDGTHTWDGKISNVRIIDGILTAEEINRLYNSEKRYYL